MSQQLSPWIYERVRHYLREAVIRFHDPYPNFARHRSLEAITAAKTIISRYRDVYPALANMVDYMDKKWTTRTASRPVLTERQRMKLGLLDAASTQRRIETQEFMRTQANKRKKNEARLLDGMSTHA